MRTIALLSAAAFMVGVAQSDVQAADTSVNSKTGINADSGISAEQGGRVNGMLRSGTNAATSNVDPDPSLTNMDDSVVDVDTSTGVKIDRSDENDEDDDLKAGTTINIER